MSDPHRGGTPVIEVVGASKSFILKRERVQELRESFSIGRLMRRFQGTGSEEFWAVRDVSFEVLPGQSVGIVGHNGSGKSTMLKMLTGILKPTSGAVTVRGRVGALIEVGAGFHPDLSGRENIYLNGSILGLSRREIGSKFDEIVQFAGLERFIDTPVKRYSSGMYMRLGMAIAFHTDPHVLLIDEVLAVGDTQFQRKCIRRLAEFVKDGGAAIFVSHSMSQIAEVCETCVWLDHGQALYKGPTDQAIERYMAVVAEREDEEFKRNHPEDWAAREAERQTKERAQAEAQRQLEWEDARRREIEEAEQRKRSEFLSSPDRPRLLGATVLGDEGEPKTNFRVGERLEIRIGYDFRLHPVRPVFGLEFYRQDGLYCFGTSNYDHRLPFTDMPVSGEAVLRVDFLSLNAGDYRIRLRLWADCGVAGWTENPDDVMEDAGHIQVDAGPFGHGAAYVPVHWFPSVAGSEGMEPAETRRVTTLAETWTETAAAAGAGFVRANGQVIGD